MHACIDGTNDAHADSEGHSALLVTMETSDMINVSNKLGVDAVSSLETEVFSTG